MDSNKDLDELITNHLNTHKYHEIDIVNRTANLFISFEEQFICSVNGETFYKLPYKDITVNIFNSEIEEIHSNTFQGFCTTVSEALQELCAGSPTSSHILDCYEKFTHHIDLAFIQRQFILKSAKEAKEFAGTARNIATTANEVAKKAKTASTQAENIAIKAEKLANEAEEQAKSTIANYIAILGIFASIIFTLFGGVNLISATVKLLEANSRWPYLTFIIALLMICLLTLLNMLIKWINSINNLKDELEKRGINSGVQANIPKKDKSILDKVWGVDFYTKSVTFFLLILVISLGGMYGIKKENFFSFSTETTSKHLESNSVKNSKNTEDKLNSKDIGNIEKTVIEKYTISNKPDNDEPDKAEQKD